jgi:hypothetical protein
MPEIVLFGFAFDHLAEKLAQLLVACPFAHRRFDIEFEMAAQTGSQFFFTGETQFVAALAEGQVRHRPDETDPLLRSAIFSMTTFVPHRRAPRQRNSVSDTAVTNC